MDLSALQNQRSSARHETRMFVTIRNAFQKKGAMVSDISATGMGVEMHDTMGMRQGDFVEVHCKDLGYINGVVRWVRGRRVGIEFENTSNNSAKIAAFFRYFYR